MHQQTHVKSVVDQVVREILGIPDSDELSDEVDLSKHYRLGPSALTRIAEALESRLLLPGRSVSRLIDFDATTSFSALLETARDACRREDALSV